MYPVEYHSNWMKFYPDAGEKNPKDLPPEKGPRVSMTVYVYSDHARDQFTNFFFKGILVMLNNTPIRWISKGQKTVKTSTYGSELVVLSITPELILWVIYMLHSLLPILQVFWRRNIILGENMSVVLNTTVSLSVLKKKHNALTYHRVREAIAARIMRFAYIKSEENVNDVLTKPSKI
jgi:hypothetical protein